MGEKEELSALVDGHGRAQRGREEACPGATRASRGRGRVRGVSIGRRLLPARKNYRKSEDIDLRLPQASMALDGVPRMGSPRVKGGIQEARSLAHGAHSEGSDGPGWPVRATSPPALQA